MEQTFEQIVDSFIKQAKGNELRGFFVLFDDKTQHMSSVLLDLNDEEFIYSISRLTDDLLRSKKEGAENAKIEIKK